METIRKTIARVSYVDAYGWAWDGKKRGGLPVCVTFEGKWKMMARGHILVCEKPDSLDYMNEAVIYKTDTQWRVFHGGKYRLPDHCVVQLSCSGHIFNVAQIPVFVKFRENGVVYELVGVLGSNEERTEQCLFAIDSDDDMIKNLNFSHIDAHEFTTGRVRVGSQPAYSPEVQEQVVVFKEIEELMTAKKEVEGRKGFAVEEEEIDRKIKESTKQYLKLVDKAGRLPPKEEEVTQIGKVRMKKSKRTSVRDEKLVQEVVEEPDLEVSPGRKTLVTFGAEENYSSPKLPGRIETIDGRKVLNLSHMRVDMKKEEKPVFKPIFSSQRELEEEEEMSQML